MLKGFKDFIMRGNVIDLAVGVIIGGAFTAIVTALTDSPFSQSLTSLAPPTWQDWVSKSRKMKIFY